jgi:hypothetical protein
MQQTGRRVAEGVGKRCYGDNGTFNLQINSDFVEQQHQHQQASNS